MKEYLRITFLMKFIFFLYSMPFFFSFIDDQEHFASAWDRVKTDTHESSAGDLQTPGFSSVHSIYRQKVLNLDRSTKCPVEEYETHPIHQSAKICFWSCISCECIWSCIPS